MILLWLEYSLHDFNFFEFVKVYFMTQNMVCLGDCSIENWKEYIFWFCQISCSINVNQILWIDDVVKLFYILYNFCLVTLTIAESEIMKSPIITLGLSILLSALSILRHILWRSVVWCIHIYDHHIYSVDWSFYKYVTF